MLWLYPLPAKSRKLQETIKMGKDLANYRRVYSQGALLENEIPEDPIVLFHDWFEEMEQIKNPIEVNAMTVATVGPDGFPESRVVLLKEFFQEGFVFYTNYNSAKGLSLAQNPNICLSFFWPEMERQVIIKGKAEKFSQDKAIAYFKTRPRGSQLGAWASDQSTTIASREILENKLKDLELKYKEKEIPKPEFWGGYLVKPVNFEFWQGRPNRLHDRIQYKKVETIWKINRLAP